jgi:hypothetical protein
VFLERSLRLAFRNFSTLFLLIAIVTTPLHLIYAFAFRDVIAVTELHSRIDEFPPDRKVQGVGPSDLDAARLALLGITIAELALIPLLVRAVGRVAAVDEGGGIPTVADAWSHRGEAKTTLVHAVGGAGLPTVAATLVISVLFGVLLERIGMILIDPLPPSEAFLGVGVVQAVSRAAGAPFFLMGVAMAGREAKATTGETPSLY